MLLVTRAVLEWKEPLVREAHATHPSGIVELNDSDMEMFEGGTGWPGIIVSATIAASIQWCSPSGTFCGSCAFGTAGCCR